MTVHVDLPNELLEKLGQDPERKLLEAVLLQLIHDGEISVGYAGGVLNLDRMEAIAWYTSHGYDYFDQTPDELEGELETLRRLVP
jgi:hypothetical protein